MNRNLLVFTFILITIFPLCSNAQRWKLRRCEASAGVGGISYFGDIGGTADKNNLLGFKDIQLKYVRPSIFVSSGFRLSEDIRIRLNLLYGAIAGDDANSRNNDRNFAFTSTIFEPSFQFEYYLIPEDKTFSSSAIFSRRGMINDYMQLSAYLFAGFGGVYSDPTPRKNFVNVFDENFSKFGIIFPVGIGIKYSIDSHWSWGIELGRRFTLTDYIDGYTSDYSKNNDAYYVGSIRAIYKIRTDRRGIPIFSSKLR